MYYYKARIYSPTLGRFMQTDPIRFAGGMNLYAYVHANPINMSDPLGLEEQGPIVITGEPCPRGWICYDPGHGFQILQSTVSVDGADEQGEVIITAAKPKPKPQQTASQRNKACEALRNNTDRSKGVLPPYLVNNKNWYDVSTLRGYRSLYQSSNDEFTAVTGTRAQLISTAIAVACALYEPCSVAKYGVTLTVGLAVEQWSSGELRDSTAAAVRAIDARIQQLDAGC